jgi:hypothetical protein
MSAAPGVNRAAVRTDLEHVPPVLVPEDYALGKCLHANPRTEVYAATHKSDTRAVVLKW